MYIYTSDCEGPLTVNDNAFELCKEFIPEGDKFFHRISQYDDYLFDIEKRPGYQAGNTLKLILPFLLAFGVNQEQVYQFSLKTLLLVKGADETLKRLKGYLPLYLISTSYSPYIEALCKATGFDFSNTYSTYIDLDRWKLSVTEKDYIMSLTYKISSLPEITWDNNAKSIDDLSIEVQEAISILDDIIWHEVKNLEVGKIVDEVTTIGANEKAKALMDIAKKNSVGLSDIMYVGDSITDVEAFRLLNTNNGLSVSFNGNKYAVNEAQLIVAAPDTSILTLLGILYAKGGKDKVLEVVRTLSCNGDYSFDDEGLDIKISSQVAIANKSDIEDIEKYINLSLKMRTTVRGAAIAALG